MTALGDIGSPFRIVAYPLLLLLPIRHLSRYARLSPGMFSGGSHTSIMESLRTALFSDGHIPSVPSWSGSSTIYC